MVQVNKATEREQKTVAQVRKAESRVKKIAGPVKKASGPVKATAEQLKTDTGRAVRGTGKFKCDHCGTRTARKCDLERHINRMHRGVSFQCARCELEFGQQHNLVIHELTRHEGVKYFCISPDVVNPTALCAFVCDHPSGMTPHRKKFHKEALNTKNALFFPNKGIKYDGPLPLELFDANGQTYSRYTDVQTPSSSTSSEPSTAPSSPSVSTPLTLPADLSPPSPRVDASKDPMESFSSAASGYSPPTTLSYPSSCRSSSPTGSSLVSAENESWSRFKSLVDTAANMPRLPIIGAGGMP